MQNFLSLFEKHWNLFINSIISIDKDYLVKDILIANSKSISYKNANKQVMISSKCC